MAIICGTDEAGRGPVIGPMVMAGVCIEESQEEELRSMGVKDSKLLSPAQRERLFDAVKQVAKDHFILMISPQEIDDSLSRPGTNLNWLEADDTAKIVNKLHPDIVVIDCPSPNINAYSSYIKERLDSKDVKLVVEHKADANHPVCAAASILAKVTRDREIERIKREVGMPFGSGYPADPATASFLRTHWDKYPDIFRKSWACYKKVKQEQAQKGLGEF